MADNDPVQLTPASERISVGAPRVRRVDGDIKPPPTQPVMLTPEDAEAMQKREADRAKYKIEVIFHPTKRSSLSYKPSPVMVLIWESGKRLHGGGDEKMYWCGYADCAKPIPSDDFGYMHTVCRHCKREMFLDPDGKRLHIKEAKAQGKDWSGIEKMPFVVGEKMANLSPSNLAVLLSKTWYQLEGLADVYFKYTVRSIRFDALHETAADRKNLELARTVREPGIYTLKRIREDIAAGGDLRSRFLAMIIA